MQPVWSMYPGQNYQLKHPRYPEAGPLSFLSNLSKSHNSIAYSVAAVIDLRKISSMWYYISL